MDWASPSTKRLATLVYRRAYAGKTGSAVRGEEKKGACKSHAWHKGGRTGIIRTTWTVEERDVYFTKATVENIIIVAMLLAHVSVSSGCMVMIALVRAVVGACLPPLPSPFKSGLLRDRRGS